MGPWLGLLPGISLGGGSVEVEVGGGTMLRCGDIVPESAAEDG